MLEGCLLVTLSFNCRCWCFYFKGAFEEGPLLLEGSPWHPLWEERKRALVALLLGAPLSIPRQCRHSLLFAPSELYVPVGPPRPPGKHPWRPCGHCPCPPHVLGSLLATSSFSLHFWITVQYNRWGNFRIKEKGSACPFDTWPSRVPREPWRCEARGGFLPFPSRFSGDPTTHLASDVPSAPSLGHLHAIPFSLVTGDTRWGTSCHPSLSFLAKG